jgi:hypothetical protein
LRAGLGAPLYAAVVKNAEKIRDTSAVFRFAVVLNLARKVADFLISDLRPIENRPQVGNLPHSSLF